MAQVGKQRERQLDSCVSRAAMVNGTAEEQFRIRARRALEANELYTARGDRNKKILEEVREEVKRARKDVQAAAHAGSKGTRWSAEDLFSIFFYKVRHL